MPGVRNFGAHVGQAAAGDEVYGIYFVENWISIDPDQDYDETLDRSRRSSTGTRACGVTSRPTSRNGSARS